MNNYEVIFGLKPGISDTDKTQILEKIKTLTQGKEGTITNFDEWGLKQLAYPIKNFYEATYYRIEFKQNPLYIKDIRESLRINENILRFIITVIDRDFTKRKEKKINPNPKKRNYGNNNFQGGHENGRSN
jgi:small subunit ribosomal protein S6